MSDEPKPEVVPSLAGQPLSEVVMALRQFVMAADANVAQCRAELDAHKSRVVRSRDLLAQAEAKAKQVRRSLDALTGGLPGRVGRPRGTVDPHSTRSLVAALLPQRENWRPSDLRTALANDGHIVGASSITAALATLRKDGTAWNVGGGRWAGRAEDAAVEDAEHDDVRETA